MVLDEHSHDISHHFSFLLSIIDDFVTTLQKEVGSHNHGHVVQSHLVVRLVLNDLTQRTKQCLNGKNVDYYHCLLSFHIIGLWSMSQLFVPFFKVNLYDYSFVSYESKGGFLLVTHRSIFCLVRILTTGVTASFIQKQYEGLPLGFSDEQVSGE